MAANFCWPISSFDPPLRGGAAAILDAPVEKCLFMAPFSVNQWIVSVGGADGSKDSPLLRDA